MSQDLKRTPLFEQHRALGARIVPFAGWQMPVQYAGILQEHAAVRERAGLFDVSHMGELFLTGPAALGCADKLVTNDVAALAQGQALYTVCCNERGTILDDLIIYRLAEEQILVVCNASNRDKIAAHFQDQIGNECEVADQSDQWALIALQGPRAVAILKDAGTDPTTLDLPFFHVVQSNVAGCSCWVARTGYTGEDGFEIFCANNDAARVWEALIHEGQPHGLEPAGLGARDTLRLEARLPLYGNDIDETTHPFEAGLGWVVKLDRGPFLGKAALIETKAAGLTRKLVGFEMTERGIARHGYPIVVGQQVVGTVTSGSPGPTVGKNIGLGYVPTEHSRIGTQLGIEIRGRVAQAVIVKTPFYKRQR